MIRKWTAHVEALEARLEEILDAGLDPALVREGLADAAGIFEKPCPNTALRAMDKVEAVMRRLLVRFYTRLPNHRDLSLVAALVLYDLSPREVVARLVHLRERVRRSPRGLLGPNGVLINDGSVLAAELLRSLPHRPLGHLSLAPPGTEADARLDVITNLALPAARWKFLLDGSPISGFPRPRPREESA